MDILTDIEERLVAAVLDDGAVRKVLEAVRRDWSGERVYIAKSSREARQYAERRNRALLRDYQRGERVPLLARRYGISLKRVYAILARENGRPV